MGATTQHEGTSWGPDVLGEGWESLTIPLPPDDQGDDAVATLVRRTPRDGEEPTGRAVLYVHGYVDYFFQTHLGDALAAMGYAVYALDLRDHGRSIRDGRLPNYTTRLSVHAQELDRAARLVRDDGNDTLVVMGHSTGGLVTSLWADARRGRPGAGPDALVLNSPWLDLNRPWVDRVITTRVVDVLGRVAPRQRVGALGDAYGRWLSDPSGGGWEYDLTWKPHGGFGVRAGWLRSVRRAHAAVARGLDVEVPVLVCTSDATGPRDRDHDALDRTDSVLAVEHMWQRAPRLGRDVTVVRVPGGVHDLALSPEPARTVYLEAVRDWLERRLPA
ncbi:alpha/beta hydrolase [Actinotalea sp. AC32]|nr:alpha/beta hydrolase [Actinotalea sp. AC32]